MEASGRRAFEARWEYSGQSKERREGWSCQQVGSATTQPVRKETKRLYAVEASIPRSILNLFFETASSMLHATYSMLASQAEALSRQPTQHVLCCTLLNTLPRGLTKAHV